MISADFTKLSTVIAFYVVPAPTFPGLVQGTADGAINQFIDGLEAQPGPEGMLFMSMYNQLKLTVSPESLIFEDASESVPVRDDFPDRVTRTARHFSQTSGLAFGFLELSFDVEAPNADEDLVPSAAILRGLIKEGPVPGHRVVGAAVKLWYSAHDRLYTLRLEPRFQALDGSPYYAHVRVQINLTDGHSGSWLAQVMREEFNSFTELLTDILKPEERRNDNR